MVAVIVSLPSLFPTPQGGSSSPQRHEATKDAQYFSLAEASGVDEPLSHPSLLSSVFKLRSSVSSLTYHSPHSQLLLLSTRRLTAACPLAIPAVPTPALLSPVFLARRSFSVGGPSLHSLTFYRLLLTVYYFPSQITFGISLHIPFLNSLASLITFLP